MSSTKLLNLDVTARTPERSSRRYRRLMKAVPTLVFAIPGLLVLAVVSLYPMLIMIQMSVSDVTIANIIGDWPLVGFQNFVDVFGSDTFRSVTLQTIFFVLAVLVATMGAGFIVGLILRPSKGFSLITQTTLILVWTLPPVIIGSLGKFLLASDGIINQALLAIHVIDQPQPFLSQPSTALASIAAVTVWISVPFAALVIKSAILDVPEEVLDAAQVDGANAFQTITRIVLPIIRPTLLILGVLTVVGAFKAFDLIYTMSRGGPGTSSTTIPYLGYTTAFQTYQFGQAAAISIVAMAIVLILAIAYIIAVRKEEK